MLAIQPAGLHSAQEELGAVGVGASVCHGQNPWASVLQGEVLICKLGSIDRLTPGAIPSSEITTLRRDRALNQNDDIFEDTTRQLGTLNRQFVEE